LYSTEAEIECRRFGHIAGRITIDGDGCASSDPEYHVAQDTLLACTKLLHGYWQLVFIFISVSYLNNKLSYHRDSTRRWSLWRSRSLKVNRKPACGKVR